MRIKLWSKTIKVMFFVFGVIILSALLDEYYVSAQNIYPQGTFYENSENEGFTCDRNNIRTKFSYSDDPIVTPVLSGEFGEVINKDYNGYPAYGINGKVVLYYNYAANSDPKPYMDGEDENWNIKSSDEEIIDGFDMDTDVDYGTILILESKDGINWETARAPFNDFFDDYDPKKHSKILEISEEDVIDGMYYRVLVAYRMEKEIGKNEIVRNCLEEYKFYLCSEVNHTVLKQMDGIIIDNSHYATVEEGFIVEKGGDNIKVSITRGDDYSAELKGKYSVIREKGVYNVKVFNTLDKLVYRLSVNVKIGSTQYNIKANIIETDDEYNTLKENVIPGYYYRIPEGLVYNNGLIFSKSINCSFLVNPKYHNGIISEGLTQLTISQKGVIPIDEGNVGEWKALGIYSESVALNLTLLRDPDNLGNGWRIEPDDYGKKIDKQLIKEVSTGKIEKGALIIKTSRDGVNWVYVNDTDNKYTNGIFNTNYAEYYKKGQNIQIYIPSGEDLINGVYLDVSFAYKVRNDSTKEEKNYIEEYKFYLCDNNLEDVTFHNLSVSNILREQLGTDDEILIDLYTHAESLESGAGSTTGFTIDKSKLPSAKIEVSKDGIAIPNSKEKYLDDGKYNITVTSVMGKRRDVVIYVDKSTKEKILKDYFENYNLYMKRIYVAESTLPVYESEVSLFRLKAGLGSNRMAVKFTVKKDGKIKQEHGFTRKLTDIPIDEEGEYEIIFKIAPEIGFEDSGDVRVITFRFLAIKQGTAPGPQINYDRLYNIHNQESFQDYSPIYYGVTKDAGKGQITIAFSNEQAALNYARSVEHGLVEKIENGFRYYGDYTVKRKEIYTDGWSLADAEEEFAKQKVQKLYFDFSYPSTFSTLKKEDLPEYNSETNLPDSLPYLDSSVVIFYNEDERKQLLLNDSLPLINDKVIYYVTPGNNKNPTSKRKMFTFENELNGFDSNEVKIYDVNGKEYNIEYKKGVQLQLDENNCPSGPIKIIEKTKDSKGTGLGTWKSDTREYKALYIAPGDNKSSVELKLVYTGGETKSVIVNQEITSEGTEDNIYEIHADRASLVSFNDVIDPDALIMVQRIGENSKREDITFYMVKDKNQELEFGIPDTYFIKCVNRAGNSFEFKLVIDDSAIADTIDVSLKDSQFNEISADEKRMKLKYGSNSTELPSLDHYGYDFVGYVDTENMVIYKTTEPQKIISDGSLNLETIWTAKKVDVTYKYEDGKVISNKEVDFDSEITFPEYDFEADGYDFISWMKDGKEYDSRRMRVNQVEDLIFVAKVEKKEDENVPSTTPTPTLVPTPTEIPDPIIPIPEPTWLEKYWWVILIISVLISGGAGTIIYLRRRKDV